MLINRALCKHGVPVLFYIFLLACFAAAPLSAAEPSEDASISSLFLSTDNAVTKCELLHSLKEFIPQKGETTPLWVSALLNTALNDENPVVVAEAVYQIGEFGCTALGQGLINLYENADTRFRACGYTGRVRCAIIPTLGKIGGEAAKSFIAGLLKKDHGSYMGRFLLAAIKDLHDPSFTGDLQQYKIRLHTGINRAKAAGRDPLFYSELQSYSAFIDEIIQSLGNEGDL